MHPGGFHYTRSKNEVGYKVPGSKLETAQPLPEGQSRAGWVYSEDVPEYGISREIFWFSYEDLEYLMDKPRDEVKRLARVEKWRSRLHNTTKHREFYLYDLFAGIWSYMTDFYGNKVDQELLEDANTRKRRLLP